MTPPRKSHHSASERAVRPFVATAKATRQCSECHQWMSAEFFTVNPGVCVCCLYEADRRKPEEARRWR